MKKERTYKSELRRIAIINAIKKLAFPVILTAIILVGVYVVMNYKTPEDPEELTRIDSYEGSSEPIVLENDQLKFTLDPTTTQFTVLVKSTGKEWKSNPDGAATDTSIQLSERQKLSSTLLMKYAIQSGLETEFDNYSKSVTNALYDIQTDAAKNEVRINYSLGDIEKEYIIPPVITVEEFEEWLGKMTPENADLVKNYYKKYDINKLGKKDNKEELLESYPILEEQPIWIVRDTAKKQVRIKMETIFEEVGYTLEDYSRHQELSNAEKTSDKPIFKVSMIYRLEGDQMVVEVPLSSLYYKSEYPIYTLTLLPYFGAGGTDDEGYIMVPEGGGSIINFNNGKTAQNEYFANVYGWDYGLSRKDVVHDTRAYFNAFGIANGEDSFLCTLEEGVAYAGIRADIAGKNHGYNFANATYSICVREQYDVGSIANSDIYVYLEELPDETLTQRYTFLDTNDYVDMAKSYQKYLMDKYPGQFTKNTDTTAPVALDVVGAVDKVKQIVGVPVSRPLPLTTFAEAEQVITDLYNEGMTNMSVKLTGWANGGVNQKIMKKASVVSSLGGKSGLTKLSNTVSGLGVDLYLDGVTMYEYNSNIFDGFFSFTDAAKRISRDRSEQYKYSAITYAARENWKSYYLLHPSVQAEAVDTLAAAADKYNANVSFREIGMELAADYYRKNIRSRQSMLAEQTEQLKNIAASGKKNMINMGNDFAVPYASMVTNMDLRGSEYTIIDECVPFYQIALHGYVDYTGNPINICGDEESEILYSAEYGAGLMFTLMKESAFSLQKTLYTEYYGADVDAWHDRMMSIYNRYNKELGHTFNQEIVDHKNLTEEVSCTTYADGTKVYVNYGFETATTEDGTTVNARDYKVVR